MNKLGAEELKKVVETLVQTTKCALCQNMLQLDTVVCVSGHVFCRGCRRLQTSCPTCKKDFSNVENSAFVRQVLEVIPYLCPNMGCPEVVYRRDDHEKYCMHRIIQCKYSSCKWQGSVNDLVQHCKTVHIQSSAENIIDQVLFDSSGHMFFIEVGRIQSAALMGLTVHPVLTCKPTQDIFFNLKFETQEKRITFVIKVDLETEAESRVKNTILVPLTTISQLRKENNQKLGYTSYITETK